MDKEQILMWLFDPTNSDIRGTGRTYLMAKTFIKLAINNPNQKINFFDHYKPRTRAATSHMTNEIRKLSKQLPQHQEERLVINGREHFVKYNE